ncbi:MAG TPA: histidine kinase [Candidatus Limnocylindrales bacterium]|nr:histidine kinase [Candidatus Limnocylindrales bacterium]
MSIRGRLDDRTWVLTLLVCGAALATTATMLISRFSLPSEGALIPTESWPWTSDGVGVVPIATGSTFIPGDVIVAVDGRPLAEWADAAMVPPWFLAPNRLPSLVEFDVRRAGQPIHLQVALSGFSSERLGGAPLGLVAFAAGALILALVLVIRRPAATALRLLFIGVCCNTADIVAWETSLQPTDLVGRTPFLYAFAVAALANLVFWGCIVHIVSIYPVRAGWLARRPARVRLIYAAPIAALAVGAVVLRLAGGTILDWFDRLGSLLGAIVSAMLVVILASVVAGYRRTPAPRRSQVRLLALTLGVAAGASLVLTALPITLLGYALAPRSAVAILAIPVVIALALAVIRDRLFQVDLLATSRRRIVAAREVERLRLRRDLHDGLGPTLAALGLKIDRARAEVGSDPKHAEALLDEIRQDLRSAIAQIRGISRELRPPALDSLGLDGALRQQLAAIQGPDGPVIDVDADRIDGLSPATEVAAYRIVIEAVSNAVRHSGATRCSVTIRIDDHVLEIRVEDDGRGITRDAIGIGTRAMYERAAEVGGELLVEPGLSGGTVVRASLPIGPGVGFVAGATAARTSVADAPSPVTEP